MSTGNTFGVAISTTGDEHRLGFLEAAVHHWRRALPLGSVIVVTVDGGMDALLRATVVVDKAGPNGHCGGVTVQVGQVGPGIPDRLRYRDGKLGVAVNKNTGIEWLMDAGVDHLFLCDDDTYPLSRSALRAHTEMGQRHSMVSWGKHRMKNITHANESERYVEWTWPRGVMLYVHRPVIDIVGGMDERFGPGGHEHVEFSRRIHQVGLTPVPYLTPLAYSTQTGTARLWHCEDMRRPDESSVSNGHRRKRITTVRREPGDWDKIEQVMADRDGNTSFVPYQARDNGRGSATLYAVQAGRGAAGTGSADE